MFNTADEMGVLLPKETQEFKNIILEKKKKKSLFALLTGIQVQSEVHRGINI